VREQIILCMGLKESFSLCLEGDTCTRCREEEHSRECGQQVQNSVGCGSGGGGWSSDGRAGMEGWLVLHAN
jgi:hypothetical protein